MAHYKKKTDGNQKAIVKGLTDRYGVGTVELLSTVGRGVPDLLCSAGGKNLLLEVKTDTGDLTPSQMEWHRQWKGQVAVVRNLDEAIEVIEEALGASGSHVVPTVPTGSHGLGNRNFV